MKVKITKSQLKQLIKEEANRYKKVLELQERREQLIQQIVEMYESDMDIDMEEGWLGDKVTQAGKYIGKKLGDMYSGSDAEIEAKLRKHFASMQALAKSRGVEFEMPVDELDWANALRAAKKLGDFDIVKRNGVWGPRMRGTPNYQSS